MQLDLLTYAPPVKFHGETYSAEFDEARLAAQAKRVWELMRDGRWRSLQEIAQETCDPQASVSARLRDFRKAGLTVDRQSRGERERGVYGKRYE